MGENSTFKSAYFSVALPFSCSRERALHRTKVNRGDLLNVVRELRPQKVAYGSMRFSTPQGVAFPGNGNGSAADQTLAELREAHKQRLARCGGEIDPAPSLIVSAGR